jgi:hypothetical protein
MAKSSPAVMRMSQEGELRKGCLACGVRHLSRYPESYYQLQIQMVSPIMGCGHRHTSKKRISGPMPPGHLYNALLLVFGAVHGGLSRIRLCSELEQT